MEGLGVRQTMRLAMDPIARQRELLRVLPIRRIVIVPQQRQTFPLRGKPFP
jgi:hypothetical protein